MLNLIIEQDDIDNIYFYAKDLSEPKYEFLIKKCKNAGTKHLNDPNALVKCSNTMDDVYGDTDNYNPNRKRNILIVFDDIIADIKPNEKFRAMAPELFIRCRKINISLIFITQPYFSVPKDARLNSSHYLIMKISNKRELQNISINDATDIDYKDILKNYRECTRETFYFFDN